MAELRRRLPDGRMVEYQEAHWIEPMQPDGSRRAECTVLIDGKPFQHVVTITGEDQIAAAGIGMVRDETHRQRTIGGRDGESS